MQSFTYPSIMFMNIEIKLERTIEQFWNIGSIPVNTKTQVRYSFMDLLPDKVKSQLAHALGTFSPRRGLAIPTCRDACRDI